jgi:perosamine synthetase
MSTLKKKGLPDNVIPWAKPYLGEKEKEYLIKAFSSTWISGGEFVDKFESDFSSIIGGKYTVTTSNGTTALHLALLAAGTGPGDEVIVPAFTFVAPANVTIQTGAKPVFVAIDPQTWCIDADEVRKAITPSTKAIIPVHVYGNVCEMDTLVKIAEDSGVYIIEDTAEAVFSKYRGMPVVSVTSAVSVSRQPRQLPRVKAEP